jgi:hypothetical protein
MIALDNHLSIGTIKDKLWNLIHPESEASTKIQLFYRRKI